MGCSWYTSFLLTTPYTKKKKGLGWGGEGRGECVFIKKSVDRTRCLGVFMNRV